MKKISYLIIFFIFIFFISAPLRANRLGDSIITITVTGQSYDFTAPWQKLPIQKEVITGILLKENKILTLSYKLKDHVLIEASKFGSFRKYPAKVILKDYHCGLALITVTDNSFYNDLKPVEFNSRGSIKDKKALIIKWDNNGILKEHPAEYLKSAVEFFESTGVVLIHQMISEIDTAGKGEPVFVDGKLAGIASWHLSKTKTIKVIDLIVIERMLKDIQSGNYKGMPFFYVEDSALENDENLREYLGLKKEDTGIHLINVPPQTSGSDVLKKGDVILNIDNIDIDDNGLYLSQKYGKLTYYGLIFLNHFVGDTVKMDVFRDKKKIEISFKLKPFSEDSFLIPPLTYDTPPKYYIIGGLVFQDLTKEYLKTWGKEWPSTADKRLMYYHDNFTRYPSPDRKKIVLLTSVLPAAVNLGYHNLKNLILDKVNGIIVKDIAHFNEIIAKSNDKYLEFDFAGDRRIVIDNKEAKSSINDIMKKYKIQAPYYLGEKK